MSVSLDGVLIRKAHKSQPMTTEEMLEFAKCADPDTGYKHFMENYFYIQHPTKGKLQYEPYKFQEGLIGNYHDNRFSIALMPRQTGKCLLGDTNIRIKNKKTGEIQEISIEQFYDLCKKGK